MRVILGLVLWVVLDADAVAQAPGVVMGESKISASAGGFVGPLDNVDEFGHGLAWIGSLVTGGPEYIAVGAHKDDDGGTNRGALWLLAIVGGQVVAESKISATAGGFVGPLDDDARFGSGVAPLGDLDGDGVVDIVVGAPLLGDDDRGALWILFLGPNETVKAETKIASGVGGFPGNLPLGATFGRDAAALGDLNGDDVQDIAVGAPNETPGGGPGSVWILFLNADGTVKAAQEIGDGVGGMTGDLDPGDGFGWSVASLGDRNGDGTPDLAVGARYDDDGGESRGAVWILDLTPVGTVLASQKISDVVGGFGGLLEDIDEFGTAVALLNDLDGNGVRDLAVGEIRDDDGGTRRGAAWVLFMGENAMVIDEQKISSTEGAFAGPLDNFDTFGISLTPIANTNTLAVGAILDDDGGSDRGAVWLLDLASAPPSPWADLGNALAGVNGESGLDGAGSLNAGEPVVLTLTNAAPFAPTFLVIGVTAISAPFKGGVMVPKPDILFGLFSDGFGNLTFGGPWPAGIPSGITTYYQYWIVDSGGPKGLAASNAISGMTP